MKQDNWTVLISTKLSKSVAQLPEHVRLKMLALIKDLEIRGPVQPTWPHYSKLKEDVYHCHVRRGRPTYVMCWRLINKEKKVLEVYYAGTHEKAPY